MTALIILFSDDLPPRQALMLRTLKRLGWRILVIAWDREGDLPDHEGYRDFVDEWLWVRLPAPIWSSRLIFKLPQFYARARRLLSGLPAPELVILTHFFLLPLGYFFSCKKVYDAAEMEYIMLSFYFGPARRLAQPALALLEGLMLRPLDGVTCVDSWQGFFARYLKRWNRLVQVIWNVPAKTAAGPEPEAPADDFSGRRLVIYAGGIMREQGFRVALQAAAIIKRSCHQALFVFIGPMKDDPDIMQRLMAMHGLEGHVRLMGFLPYRRMLAYLSQAEIALVLPQPEFMNLYVSSGNSRKFFTYMEAGLPMVAPSFRELGAVVQQEHCGVLVDSTDPEAVAQGILYLLEHPKEARRMGQNGRRAFEDKYNWEREEGKYVAFIDRVMESSG